MTRVVVASHNPDKIAEMKDLLLTLGFEVVEGFSWGAVDETEPTLEGNALLKARAVFRATGLVAVADDTGLEVSALNGAPGVRSARFAGDEATYSQNVEALLAAMDGQSDRSAAFRTAVAMVGPEMADVVVGGSVEGVITTSPRGQGGFGYDPIFEVNGRTFAEMSPEEKRGISHRSRALGELARALSN